MNINGALEVNDIEVTIYVDTFVNAQSTIKLVEKIEEKYEEADRIVMICNNARYYKSKLVQECLKSSKIELLFLPPYAPNFNLIERLWRFMNKKVRDNKYYEKFSEFKIIIYSFLKTLTPIDRRYRDYWLKNSVLQIDCVNS